MIDLKNKKVVVFGLGVSGLSALKLLNRLGAITFAVNSGNVESWAKSPGVLDYTVLKNCFADNSEAAKEMMATADIIILSPGIPRDHFVLTSANQKNIPIWGEIELGYKVIEHFNALKPIIAITGTNGKTTTTTFLGEILEDQGLRPFVGGNIGVPFCDMALEVINQTANYDYIVLELSSFQLESTFDFHPHISMILNVFQNHGERYTEILDYARAKFNITKKMTAADYLIYPTDYPIIESWAKTLKCQTIGFDTRNFSIDFDLSKFKLPGQHNKVNLNFLIKVMEILKLDRNKFQMSIDRFNGVHHRIEYVPNQLGFTAYNDAKSTNWDATLTAIAAMEDKSKDLYLILGGKKRGHGDSILPYIEAIKARVKRIYLIGEMALEIEAEIKNIIEYKKLETLEKTIQDVKAENFQGILLFSPAFPSFDQFSNYAERGKTFVNLLKN